MISYLLIYRNPVFTYSIHQTILGPARFLVLSCCSAVSESDVGDQLVLLSSLAQLQNLDS